MIEKKSDSMRKRNRVLGRNKNSSSTVLHQLGISANACCNDRKSSRHCFQNDVRQTLRQRRMHDDVDVMKNLFNIVSFTCEDKAAVQLQLPGECIHL
jgi:hypothetical protein